jgi:hypothetical protein
MDVSFMIVYVGQGPLTPEGFDNAYKQSIAKFHAIHRLAEQIAPDQIGLALTPADVIVLHKKVSVPQSSGMAFDLAGAARLAERVPPWKGPAPPVAATGGF